MSLASIRSQVLTAVDIIYEQKLDDASLKSPREDIIKAKKEQGEEKPDSTYSHQGRSTKKRAGFCRFYSFRLSGQLNLPPKADDQSKRNQGRLSTLLPNNIQPSPVNWMGRSLTHKRAGVDSPWHRSDPESEHSDNLQMTFQSKD
ncbi:hypothetical protein Tco_0058389 [Tanacetum coccineum]